MSKKKDKSYGVLFGNEDIDVRSINNPCPRHEDKVLKEAGKSISLKEFAAYLKLLSWEIEDIGCDHYAIINHKGERTNWELEERDNAKRLQLSFFNDDAAFGTQAHSGFFYMCLEDAELRIDGSTIFISFGNPKKGGSCLFFSNYDEHFEPHQQYEFDLPKKYQARLKCSECGALVLESRPMSGVEYLNNRFRMAFSGPLCSGACPKCGYSTYSDMNSHTNKVMYRIVTGRKISDKTIERESVEEVKEYNRLVDEYRDREWEKKRKLEEEGKVKA